MSRRSATEPPVGSEVRMDGRMGREEQEEAEGIFWSPDFLMGCMLALQEGCAASGNLQVVQGVSERQDSEHIV